MSKTKLQLDVQVKEQEVLKSELSNLKVGAKVYKQQQNSNVYFLENREKVFSECKKTLDDLVAEYKELESLTATDQEKNAEYDDDT